MVCVGSGCPGSLAWKFMIRFSLLLPTRDRISLIERLLASILKTTADPSSLEIVLYIDDDDKESLKIHSSELTLVKLVKGRDTMGGITRSLFEASHGEFLVLINDDAVFRTKNWDKIVLNTFLRFPDGIALLYPNDHYYGKKMCTFPILSRKACELMGKICPSAYESHCIDAHIMDVFKRLADFGEKRMVYLPHVIFEHMHYALGIAAFKEQYPPLKTDWDDQQRYLTLLPERVAAAQRLLQHIKTFRKMGTLPSRQSRNQISKDRKTLGSFSSGVSVILYPAKELWQSKIVDAIRSLYEDSQTSKIPLEVILPTFGNDRTYKLLPKSLIRLIKFQRLDGKADLAQTLNQCVQRAQKSHLIFLQFPFSIKRGWLQALSDASGNPNVGIVGSKWLNPRTGKVEQAGMAFYEEAGQWHWTYLYRGFEPENFIVNRPRALQAVPLCGMSIPKEIFRQVGGFSQSIENHVPFELCLKVRSRGYQVIFEPRAGFYHADCSSLVVGEKAYRTLDSSFLNRTGKIESDFLRLVEKDGLFLKQDGLHRYLLSDITKIEELKKSNQGEELTQFLERNLVMWNVLHDFDGSSEALLETFSLRDGGGRHGQRTI